MKKGDGRTQGPTTPQPHPARPYDTTLHVMPIDIPFLTLYALEFLIMAELLNIR